MKQLTAMDAQMLFIETPEAPNHVAPLAIYDPSTAPGGKVTHKDILANLESRLHLAPNFRRKLVRVPLELDEPWWVDDPNFDIEYHVRHLALPKPGDWRQLCILVARLIARPLDQSRPLWEMNIIEGLDNVKGFPPGAFAVLLKIHHSLIDGKAGVELINVLHDLEPQPRGRGKARPRPWTPEPQPTQWELARTGLRRVLTVPGHVLRVAARSAPDLIRHRDAKKTKVPVLVPVTPFNRPITARRVYDARFFDLADFKRIRALVPGATINDVALGVVAGTMRRYLEAKGELPEPSLIASVPISIRSKDSASQTEGNELIVQNVPLHTGIADPVERLQAICDTMRDTKSYVEAVGAKTLAAVSTALPGVVSGLLARAVTAVAYRSGTALMANTVVTNVPGAQVPLYMSGAKAVMMCGGGPLAATIGIIHLVGSYCGTVHINYTAARDLLPDPDFYSKCLQASFDEYARAAAGKSLASAAPRKLRRAAKPAAEKARTARGRTGK